MESVDPELEDVAALLSGSGDYRVLRRLVPDIGGRPAINTPTRKAIFLDVETTGLDATRDEIIELAMVPFEYAPDGSGLWAGEPFQSYHEPSRPIPVEITSITGITDEIVRGRHIDIAEVRRLVAPVVLIVAHNAAFDRAFTERLDPVFATKAWACSMTQVDWADVGYEGSSLGYLAAQAGFFYDQHSAVQDCYAALELLKRTPPRSTRPALAHLLERARRTSYRIWAENSPFDLRELLKARGYRWNGDPIGTPRSWYIDVDVDQIDDEMKFLRAEIYLGDVSLTVSKITAFDRFSGRV